ncbi:exodeoxyribonuclease V subunit alpha [Parasalinivibrio latis]
MEVLSASGAFRPLDIQFAKFIASQETGADANLVGVFAALASHELASGHVCVDLTAARHHRLWGKPEMAALGHWLFGDENLVSLSQASTISDGSMATPLVLEDGRLYLYRYWQYERDVAALILRLGRPQAVQDEKRALLDSLFVPPFEMLMAQAGQYAEKADAEVQDYLSDVLDVVDATQVDWPAVVTAFRKGESLAGHVPLSACLNWQKVAAAVALTRHFTVISGGPGTGKTTTVAKLLAALVSHEEIPPVIKLVAPTGKAANRLTESIGNAVQSLPVSEEIRANIPVQASTIHRLLGAVPQRAGFRHNARNRLHLDILIVDEASMVDLPLMASLLAALPDKARVILLGDKDQLASVEAGAVLGDICQFVDDGFSERQAKTVGELTGYNLAAFNTGRYPVSDGLCLLRKSYRFHARSGIGQLAYAINDGNTAKAGTVFKLGFEDIAYREMDADGYQAAIDLSVDGYRTYLELLKNNAEPETVLNVFSRCRLLCALTEGPFGVAGLNRRIENALAAKGLLKPGDELFYPGRPVMVVQNDHGVGLYNGDIGITVMTENGLRVVFDQPDGSVRAVLPSRLPPHQTAFAMTIHKSQGSEFDNVVMVMPTEFSPVICRELIYTGVTRAKKRLDIFAGRKVFEKGIRDRVERYTGLASLLAK